MSTITCISTLSRSNEAKNWFRSETEHITPSRSEVKQQIIIVQHSKTQCYVSQFNLIRIFQSKELLIPLFHRDM